MKPKEHGDFECKSTIRNQNIVIVVVLLLVPLIISISRYKVLSPFSLHAYQFSVFFPLLAISCIISYVLLEFRKFKTLNPLIKAAFPVNASIFQIAYFLFGKNRAVQTAIIDLVRRKLLVVTTDKLFQVYKERYVQLDNEQNPLIPALLEEERTCVAYDRIVYVWYNEKRLWHPVLQPVQLLAGRKEIFLKRIYLLLLPLVIGVARLVQCMFSELPAGVLFWELILLIVICRVLIKYVTCSSMVRWKAKQLVNRQRETQVLYPHYIVSSFAFEGSDAIERYSDGLALIEIFRLGPFIDKISDKVWLFLKASEEEGEYIIWSSDGRQGWHYPNDPETLMKEMEEKCLR